MIYDVHNRPAAEVEVNTAPSMTIPDMSVSLSTIIKQYTLGSLPVDLVRQVLYDEEDDFDSVIQHYAPGYDLVDKERELAKLRQKFQAMHYHPKPMSPSERSNEDSHGGSDKRSNVVDEPES